MSRQVQPEPSGSHGGAAGARLPRVRQRRRRLRRRLPLPLHLRLRALLRRAAGGGSLLELSAPRLELGCGRLRSLRPGKGTACTATAVRGGSGTARAALRFGGEMTI